jgi:alpha-L-rhamnosidase
VDDIGRRGWHLSAGFVGSPYINHVLTEFGRNDAAYKLLFQKTWPSWLYPVTKGATTIWERWDGWTDENGFQDAGMNSFNHYAYGAVGAWLYQKVAGIDIDPEQPGYRHIILKPHPEEGLTWAKATYDSVNGKIESSWRSENGTFTWDVLVPPNTTATALVPASDNAQIKEGSVAAAGAEGIKAAGFENGRAKLELRPGRYSFTVQEPAQ